LDNEFNTESLFSDESMETYNTESFLFTDENMETYNTESLFTDENMETYNTESLFTESLFTDESMETYNTEFTDENTEIYGIDNENIDMKYDEDGNNENDHELENMTTEEFLENYKEMADYNENINRLNEKYPLINWNLYFKKRLENSSLNESIKYLLMNAEINSDILDYISNEVDLNDLINYCEWLVIESSRNIFQMI